MKKIVAALLLFLPLVAHSEVSVSVLCFSSAGPHPVRLEFRTYLDKYTKFYSGFVKYSHSSKPIPIVLKGIGGEEVSPQAANDAVVWLEVFGAQITGQYEMHSQGAVIYSLDYRKKSSGEITTFEIDSAPGVSSMRGCKW